MILSMKAMVSTECVLFQVAHCHGPDAKIDYPKGDASLQMHDNEIHTELQIGLLQKCQ